MVIVEVLLVGLVLWTILLLIRNPREIITNISKPFLIRLKSILLFLIFPIILLTAIVDAIFKFDLERKYKLGREYTTLKMLMQRKK